MMKTKCFVLFPLVILTLIGCRQAKLESRFESLYEDHGYNAPYDYATVEAEIAKPVFSQVFPEAHMYKITLFPYPIVCSEGPCDNPPDYISMVTRKGKDYLMPDDFNQLMLDVGYELNEETRNVLIQALIVAALPTKMAEQSVTCGEGYAIDKDFGSRIYYPMLLIARLVP